MMGRHLVIACILPWLIAGCSQPKAVETSTQGVVVRGAGATFPAPLYQKWIERYRSENPDVVIEYEAVGSGEGTRLFLEEAVDFGASDAVLTDDQMATVARGVLIVPMTAGCVAIVYNVEGVSGGLRLPRNVYTDIFLGKVNSWNDARIQRANPDLELPNLPIAVVARQDGSGTTYAFTNHLATISKEWADGPGAGKAIDWPGGAMLAMGNEGVATMVARVPGAVGYVEFGLADRLGLTMASLENKAGEFVTPSGASGRQSLENSPLPENLRAFFPDPAGQSSYPIATYTWLLLYTSYAKTPETGGQLKDFVKWCLTDGQQVSEDLGYIRIAPAISNSALNALDSIE